ncbi:hypothetical protein [Oceanobacillus piezotolerans]|uniref:hypothetical protein n=1 Tax=Oceanobacillus piezotolerans TaxID=2448030 RepID=UPI001FEAEBF6|nr:hypothetical protein [Oceanobacillus piezotolerans]
MYLYVKKKNFVIDLVPALFITDMILTYILYDSDLGFGLSYQVSHMGGIALAILIAALFF